MQTLFYGGNIITMENKADLPEAVLIQDGYIKKVGSLEAIERYIREPVRKVDLGQKCLMPAFIDSHSHITMNAQMALCANISECKCFDDIIAVLKRYISDRGINQNGAVIGFGYDLPQLRENRHPDRYVLDKASMDIPILILHVSGHLCCVNSKALELNNIDAATKSPAGGKIGRICGTNEPDGYFEEAAAGLVQMGLKSRIHFEEKEIIEAMQDMYLANGITTAQDGASTGENIEFLKKIANAGLLKLDIVAYPLINVGGKGIIKNNEEIDGKYKNRLKLGGYKIILDGSPQGRTAWLSEPYQGQENGYCGYPYMKDQELKEYCTQAVREKKQLLAHCNGDAASEQFLNAYEAALKEMEKDNKKELRPVMIHCQTVRNDQLDRMNRLNMIASVFVGHVYYWGDIHINNLGIERGSRISPVADALNRNIVVNFHQDTPVTSPKMLHSVWCAVNRISKNGEIIGKEEKIDVYDALKAVTINAAYEYFEEDEKGSIREGKKADLVILNQSPLCVDKEKIKDIEVLETIKDGISVWKKLFVDKGVEYV